MSRYLDSYLGAQLQRNLMAGLPTKTKYASDFVGTPIPPCGDFADSGVGRVRSSPWLESAQIGTNVSLTLHDEIKLFTQYLEPTPYEEALRADLVKRFRTLVEGFDGSLTVKPVGSYITRLYTHTSDIDMVLTRSESLTATTAQTHTRHYNASGIGGSYSATLSSGYGVRRSSYYNAVIGPSTLRGIMYELKRSGLASSVEDVLHASTPLLRIIDRETGLKIDLTVSDGHEEKATDAVARALMTSSSSGKLKDDDEEENEMKRALITVVKMFLAIRRYGTTYTGGLNSYVVVWMVVSFVQLEWGKMRKSTATPALLAPAPSISRKTLDRGVRVDAYEDELLGLLPKMGGLTIKSGVTSTNARASLSTNTTSSTHTLNRTPPSVAVANGTNDQMDLGDALLSFFKFYGQIFDYERLGIVFEGGGKKARYQSKLFIGKAYLLSIKCPIDSSDMGSKAYAIKHIQASFREAYEVLQRSIQRSKRQVAEGGTYSAADGKSILSKVL